MKKFLSIMMALVVMIPCALLFTGCGAKGTYTVESASVAGVEFASKEKFEESYGKKFDYESANVLEKAAAEIAAKVYCTTIELKGDGKVYYGFDAPKWWPDDEKVEEKEAGFTWKKEDDGSIGFYVGDVKSAEATYKDGKITVGGVVYAKKGLF